MDHSQDSTNAELPKPYLLADGTLVIPFNSDPRYHYWKQGGQKLDQTRAEIEAERG